MHPLYYIPVLPIANTNLMRRFSQLSAKTLRQHWVTLTAKRCKDLKIQLAVIMLVSARVGPKIKS